MNAGFAVLAKITTAATGLLTVPITLEYLGPELFGVWMTVTSFVMLLSFTDFGIGNGLVTAVAQAAGRDDVSEIRELLSSGLVATALIGAALASAFWLSHPYMAWADVLNVHSSSGSREVDSAIGILVTTFAISMPVGIVVRAQNGLQLGFASSLTQLTGALLSLGFVLLATKLRASLSWLVAAFLGGGLVTQLMGGVLFFGAWRRDLRPSLSRVTIQSTRRLLNLGVLFFLVQLSLAVGVWSDNIIVSSVLGPAEVGNYSVPAKMYALITAIVSIAINPLWPAYGEALARGDHRWAVRTLVRTMVVGTGLAAAIGLMVTAFAQPILQIWVQGRISPSLWLLAGLAGVATFEAWRTTVSAFLNGAAALRLVAAVDVTFALLCLPLRILMLRWLGLPGLPLATLTAYLVTNAIPLGAYLKQCLQMDLSQHSARSARKSQAPEDTASLNP